TTLDAAGFNGQSPKIAISPLDGSIHILYLDDLPGPDNLRHARRTPPGTTWSFEEILPSATFLDSWSLSIDSSGALHVSYAHTDDGVTYELVYGEKSGSSWSFTPVTTSGRPEQNSIAVDGSGIPHIAYYDQLNRRLMHATKASGTWTTETIHESAG